MKYLTNLKQSCDKFWQIVVKGNSLTITYGKVGTIGKTSVRTFQNERACLCESEKLIHGKLKNGYVESREFFPGRTALPPLVKAVTRKRIIGSEKFTFLPLHEVKLISVLVNRQGAEGYSRNDNDQCQRSKGLFCTAAYRVAGYAPEPGGVDKELVWLPCPGRFGVWDSGVYTLLMFAESPENTIQEGYFATAIQNLPAGVSDNDTIWTHFDFIPSDLLSRVEEMLLLPDKERQCGMDKFLAEYEQKLRRLPFCDSLANAFKALVGVYYFRARQEERDLAFTKAIEWFELSLPIINQSHHLRSEFFRDIFLQLSFCYQQINKFDNAVRYLDIYRSYDASAREACDQIKASINSMQQLHKETLSQYLKRIEQQESGNGCEEIMDILRRDIELVPDDPLFHFHMACFYSVSNRSREALYHLEEAFKKGYRNREKILNDRDLENIRKVKEFDDIRLKYLLGRDA